MGTRPVFRTPGRRTAIATLACTLVVGVVVMLEATLTDLPGPAWPVMWWVSFGVLVVSQVIATGLVSAPRGVPEGLWLPVTVILALGTFLLYVEHGLTAALIVVSAVTVARYCSARVVAAVVVSQTVIAVAAVALIGWPIGDVLASLFAYAGFQLFGVLVVHAARRETEARVELARTHAELRAASARLENASREAERLRIARDLHDVVGHQLTALTLELEVASHHVAQVAQTTVAAEHVDRARGIAKDLLGNVRAAIDEIRDPRHTLEPVLRYMAGNTPGLAVSVEIDSAHEIGDPESQVVLRLAQEAMTNTLRHAEAECLRIVVSADSEGVRVTATDDGIGVEVVHAGHGLTGMRERFESLGGSLSLRSEPGHGFSLIGYLPRAMPGGDQP